MPARTRSKWASGSVSGGRRVGQVPHLGRQPGPFGRRRSAARNVVELRGDRRVAGHVGAGEVAPDADDCTSSPACALRRGGDAGRASRAAVAPLRDRPVSILRWTRAGVAGRATAGRTAASAPALLTPMSTPAATAGASASVSSGVHSQARTGAVMPAGPQRQRLVEQGDAEPAGAAGQRRAGAGQQPVPVAVGLDDRHHLGRGAGPQPGDVGPDRGQVDDGFGGGHAVQCPRSAPADRSASTRADRGPHRGQDVGRRRWAVGRGQLAGHPVQVGAGRRGQRSGRRRRPAASR